VKIVQLRTSIKAVVIGAALGACVAGALIAVLLSWGDRQDLTRSMLERALRPGMSPPQIEYALGLPPNSLDRSLETYGCADPTACYGLVVSHSGLGAFFVPQHEIVLYLDQNKHLTSGIMTVVYRIDEHGERIEIGKSSPAYSASPPTKQIPSLERCAAKLGSSDQGSIR
jgi:hypothetical protein